MRPLCLLGSGLLRRQRSQAEHSLEVHGIDFMISDLPISLNRGLDFTWCQSPDRGLPCPDGIFFLYIDEKAVNSSTRTTRRCTEGQCLSKRERLWVVLSAKPSLALARSARPAPTLATSATRMRRCRPGSVTPNSRESALCASDSAGAFVPSAARRRCGTSSKTRGSAPKSTGMTWTEPATRRRAACPF